MSVLHNEGTKRMGGEEKEKRDRESFLLDFLFYSEAAILCDGESSERVILSDPGKRS